MVRSIDLVPSLLDLLHIGMEGQSFDGESWLGGVASGTIGGRTVYSEDVFEPRGPGAIQALRTDSVKFIRNLTQGTEEYYDLERDPAERKNIVGAVDSKVLVGMRKELNRHLLSGTATSTPFSDKERQAIASRLRALGYVE